MVKKLSTTRDKSEKGANVSQVIVVDNDLGVSEAIRRNLEHEGFCVRCATGQVALELIRDQPPNLILLDVSPALVGVDEFCLRLRAAAAAAGVPVMMFAARSTDPGKALDLESVADEIFTKPIRMGELMAKVCATLRGAEGPGEPIYDDGVLFIDSWSFSVHYEGREVRLTRKEMRLLEELARNRGQVVRREVLLNRIWGRQGYGDSRTLDVHIRKLRMKLGNPNMIETVTGVGYRLLGARA